MSAYTLFRLAQNVGQIKMATVRQPRYFFAFPRRVAPLERVHAGTAESGAPAVPCAAACRTRPTHREWRI